MEIFGSNALVRKDSNFMSPTRDSIEAKKNVSIRSANKYRNGKIKYLKLDSTTQRT